MKNLSFKKNVIVELNETQLVLINGGHHGDECINDPIQEALKKLKTGG